MFVTSLERASSRDLYPPREMEGLETTCFYIATHFTVVPEKDERISQWGRTGCLRDQFGRTILSLKFSLRPAYRVWPSLFWCRLTVSIEDLRLSSSTRTFAGLTLSRYIPISSLKLPSLVNQHKERGLWKRHWSSLVWISLTVLVVNFVFIVQSKSPTCLRDVHSRFKRNVIRFSVLRETVTLLWYFDSVR